MPSPLPPQPSASRSTQPSALPEIGPYRPLNLRRRLLLVALAVGTAVGVVVMLLDPPGGVQRTRAPAAATAAGPADCTPGQTSGCVGGTSAVIVPGVAPASR